MAGVILAALNKWKVPVPSDPKLLHELDLSEYAKKGKYRIDSTPTLSFLNKACVRTEATSAPWMLSTVTEVEETKQILRMIPILIATFVPSTMLAQISTLFVKQGTTLERHIGSFEIPPASLAGFVTISMLISVVLYDRYFVTIMARWTKNPRGISLLQRMGTGMVIHIVIMVVRHIGSFEIPPASLAGFVTLSMLISVVLYDRYFVSIMAKWTKNPRGISLLQRMGTGMVIHIVIMVVASFTDRYRLSVAKDHGVVESGKQIPLSIFVILPQFVLMGIADAFLEAEVSDSMIILEEELKLKSAATDHEHVKVIAVHASVHLPFDHRMLVQNLSSVTFNNAPVPPSVQATFPYIFAVSKFLQAGTFDLVGTIVYEIDQLPYQNTFYNGTIEVTEAGGFVSVETVFLVSLGFALLAFAGLWVRGQIQNLSKKTKRAPKVETGTRNVDASMDEWLEGTAYTQSKAGKLKKKK
nr:protein NRT1/ PTR FAMILY 5.2-like [Tanacetum cinerariifolium]